MSTSHKNLSQTSLTPDNRLHQYTIALAVSEWNNEITFSMRDAALRFLKENGIENEHIQVHYVPGAFELPLCAQWLAASETIDAVITIGCVVQGETRHFDFICDACSNGVMQVGIKFNKPVIFGVLTTENMQQAIDRSGGKHGNKGIEAAETALKMLLLKSDLGH